MGTLTRTAIIIMTSNSLTRLKAMGVGEGQGRGGRGKLWNYRNEEERAGARREWNLAALLEAVHRD